MRFDPPLRIRSAAVELPSDEESAEWAVDAGRIDAADVAASGVRALPVERDRSAPELAVGAARAALSTGASGPEGVGLVVHAWTHYQGHDFWSPAHFVAAGVGAVEASCIGVQQMCNGGVAALEVAATRIAGDPLVSTALVTTADRFDDVWFDRWSGDYGVLYGDGATACVVDRQPNVPGGDRAPLVHAVVSESLPGLEALHRDTGGFAALPRVDRRIDVRATKKSFLQKHGSHTLKAQFDGAIRRIVPQALAEAGVQARDVDKVVVPRVGAAVIRDMYEPALSAVVPAEMLHLVRDTGHLGAGDLVANLVATAAEPDVAYARLRLYITAGAGFTISATVVEHPAHLAEGEENP